MNLHDQVTQPTQPEYREIPLTKERRIARYPEFYAPQHPLAGKNGKVLVHRDTLYSAIGPGEHLCHWCGTSVHWTNNGSLEPGALVVDHLDRDIFNGTIKNLVPSCNHCNLDRQRLFPSPSIEITCPQCGALFVSKANIHGIPYRKYCSRSCVSAHQSVIRTFPPVDRECEYCHCTYKVKLRGPSGKKARFCSTACATKSQWESGRLKPTARHLAGKGYWVFVGDHPLTSQSKHKKTGEHRVILYARIGPGPHPCYWCGKMVDWRLGPIRKGTTTANDLISDHVDANRRNNAPENLVPACNRCNSGRSRVKARQHYTCQECGIGFDRLPSRNPKWNKFCSKFCRGKSQGDNMRGKIPRAAEMRMVKAGETYVQSGDHKRRAQAVTCFGCGKEFLKPIGKTRKYCSHRCYAGTLKGRTPPWRLQT